MPSRFFLACTVISIGLCCALAGSAMAEEPTTSADSQSGGASSTEGAPKSNERTELETRAPAPPSAELSALQEIIALLKKPKEQPKKDNWDRFAALSTFISTVIVALIGLYFTQSYNRAEANRRELQETRQNQINELDVVAKFMPYLTGQDETAKVTAITTIRALAGVQLATVMAELHPSAGTAAALEAIAQSPRTTTDERILAATTANKIYDTLTGIAVLFATDRQPAQGDKTVRFDARRANELAFGRGTITVPRDHRVGSIERPTMLRLEFTADPSRHVVLQDVALLEGRASFDEELEKRLEMSQNKDVLVFVHGFNVDFESAMLRTGQLSYDLALGVPAILFSWPSQRSTTAYLADQDSASFAGPHLASFLSDLAKVPHLGNVNLIAHGLGARVAIEALRSMQREDAARPVAKNLILVSPDVDRGLFAATVTNIRKNVERITVYASRNDAVLKTATSIAGSPRVGDGSAGIFVSPSVDTIDVSSRDSGVLGYGLESPLRDIFAILRTDSPPSARPNLRSATTGGGQYWIYE